jgi:hypothetical protein
LDLLFEADTIGDEGTEDMAEMVDITGEGYGSSASVKSFELKGGRLGWERPVIADSTKAEKWVSWGEYNQPHFIGGKSNPLAILSVTLIGKQSACDTHVTWSNLKFTSPPPGGPSLL